MPKLKQIADICCGPRMMYFDKQDKRVLFGDKRQESITVTDNSHRNKSGQRTIQISPDVVFDFRQIPYEDESFYLVCFDPPHLVQAGPKSWLAAKYGKLGQTWQDDIRKGFSEAFRILKPNGTLIFKWNECQIKLSEILVLTDVEPVFGNKNPKRAGTHWITFIKPE